MRRLVWVACALVLGCAPVRDGATAWEQEDPAAAVASWSGVEGKPAATVHYNLGVAAYRAGDAPLALAHWRAARRLSPRAGDVVHNLAHVRGELKGVSAPVPEPASWMEFATPTELALLGGLLLLLASIGLVRGVREEGTGWRSYALLGVIGLILGAAGARAARVPGVFVLAEDVVVRDAPDVSGRERGSLGSGSEVFVEAAAGPWVRIWDGGSRRGWVPAQAGLVAGPRGVGQARAVGASDVAVPTSTRGPIRVEDGVP